MVGLPIDGDYWAWRFSKGEITEKQMVSMAPINVRNAKVGIHEGYVYIWNAKVRARPPWERTDSDYRACAEYKKWRSCVFKRDNFTCQDCNQIGGKLEAHHIKTFRKHPNLRFDINNGITLCRKCHMLRHGRRAA